MPYPVGIAPPFPAPVFFRPPFVAKVEVKAANVQELECMPQFVLIGIHVRPHRAYSELNGLVNVYDRVKLFTGRDNALILGDLNADCSYFGPVDKKQNVLYRLKQIFKWLVEDGVKTNAGSRRVCTYDR